MRYPQVSVCGLRDVPKQGWASEPNRAGKRVSADGDRSAEASRIVNETYSEVEVCLTFYRPRAPLRSSEIDAIQSAFTLQRR